MSKKIIIATYLREWLLPPKIYRKILSFYLSCTHKITPEERKNLSRNSIFKGKYKGERCFVIGNGPSLNGVDLSKLKGEITIVMNRFERHPVLEKWQPTCYCMGDPLVCYTREAIELLKDVAKKISPEGFFFDLSMKPTIESLNVFPKDKTFFLDMCLNFEDWNINKKDIDFTQNTMGAQSTAILGIMMAIYMGCTKIYLLGIDHSWLAYQKITLMAHFYDNTNVNDEDNIENTWKYRQNIEAVLIMCKQYEKLHSYAQKRGIEIINVTENSFLDEFPRAKFEDII